MRLGSLFSGIGGLELGLERATGARTVWQVERDPFCLRVLARHWPHAERFTDVCTATALPPVDIICGGFPCQDISILGTGDGLDGARSGLWSEYRRIIGEIEPACVVAENVEALTKRGLDRVVADLANLGYVGEWHMVSAASVGAPHRRNRIFIIATHPERVQLRQQQGWGSGSGGEGSPVAGHDGAPRHASHADVSRRDRGGIPGRGAPSAADTHVASNWWESRPAPSPVRRMDDGFSIGLDGSRRRRRPPNDKRRLHALGNAVVPQVAEVVGRRVAALLKGNA
jgi:DNA (cytosine-5)-methyltransferase 1